MENIIKELSELAFASRLKMLRDTLINDVAKVYKNQNLNFEPRWFILFYLLSEKSPLSISEITSSLNITQPAVSQLADIMIKKGLVNCIKDKSDTRKKMLVLTKKGKDLKPHLQPIWDDIQNATKELFDAIGIDVMYVINKLENALEEEDMYSRIINKIKQRQEASVEIKNYTPELKEYFANLNYEWLNKYFIIEGEDKYMLEDPENYILNKGGYIYFAEIDGTILGTTALLKHDDKTYELAKMAVAQKAQGKQIGKKLAKHAINTARLKKANTIFLETSPKLTNAINLYKKLGFVQIPYSNKEQTKYNRTTFKMVLNLN